MSQCDTSTLADRFSLGRTIVEPGEIYPRWEKVFNKNRLPPTPRAARMTRLLAKGIQEDEDQGDPLY
jgi:hypothetical protein